MYHKILYCFIQTHCLSTVIIIITFISKVEIELFQDLYLYRLTDQ